MIAISLAKSSTCMLLVTHFVVNFITVLFISKICYFGLNVVHCMLVSCGVVIPMRAIDVFECLTLIPTVVFMVFLAIAESVNIK